jgi:hypothetical protein
VTLQRDPRYAASLTAPSVSLLAYGLRAAPRWFRGPAALLLVGSGLLAAGLDQGPSILEPHRAFARSEYAHDASLEPFEYVGARWVDGLERRSDFARAVDRGRRSVVEVLDGIEEALVRRSTDARYFAFSPQRRPELLPRLSEEGWAVVHHIPGCATRARAFVAALLELLPSQSDRAGRILHPPGLIIMENPGRPRAPAAPAPP